MTPWLDELEAPAEAPVLIAPANPALRSGAQPAPQPTRDLTRVLHITPARNGFKTCSPRN
jgi:hypothetical protein